MDSEAQTKVGCAVVTGGNKGTGFEICRQLASSGVPVVLTNRDVTKGLEAVEKLKNSLGLLMLFFINLMYLIHAGISGAITDAAGFTALGQDLVEVNVYLITRLTNENIATYAIWG
ncbi:hypothetical protein C5167_004787 [Papaver somniferum]|uniref:Uncharacterized protein n=1 Tax=Papaver somniferum TaxID=3469 RepID=A0A4Y7JCG8_PAPSO|nr:hypothetical protein C5167_004787 [Papaver somniferum]